MKYPMQAFTKATAMLPLFAFFKVKLHYPGGKKPRRYRHIRGGTILVANHTSMWDPILMGYLYAFREIRIWAASRLYQYNRLFSWFLRKMGFIRVDRDVADLSAVQEAIDTLARGGLVGVFPEGRLSRDGATLPYKPGAAMVALKSGAPIVPLYIEGSYGLFRRVHVMIGDAVDLRHHFRPDIPYAQALAGANRLLEGRVAALKAELYAQRGLPPPDANAQDGAGEPEARETYRNGA